MNIINVLQTPKYIKIQFLQSKEVAATIIIYSEFQIRKVANHHLVRKTAPLITL